MRMTDAGWGYLCERAKPERREFLQIYAKQYIEPLFASYPELYGKVYLALRKKGFFAEYDPVLHIIVPERALTAYTPFQLRSIAAHEMLHLVQFQNEVGKKSQSKKYEYQATFLSWARGCAYDFVMSFPASCKETACAFSNRHGYFSCGAIFSKCCRDCSEPELRSLAKKLEGLSFRYTLSDLPDFEAVVRRELGTEKDEKEGNP